MAELWGSLPPIQDTESGIAAIEREQMTKPRPLDVEGPLLYQPSTSTYKPCDELGQLSKGFQVNEFTRHTIQLIQHKRKLQAKVQQLKLKLETSKSKEPDFSDISPTPPVPAAPSSRVKTSAEQTLSFTPRDEMSLFVRGFGKAPPRIDKITRHRLLRQSVAAICAHTGYETCSASTLEALTDVCAEFLCQMTSQLRTAVDQEAIHGDAGFPDAISRVLNEMGCGDFTTLHDFYQTRIVSYQSRLQHTVQSLYDQCERYRKADPSVAGTSEQTLTRVTGGSHDICFPSVDTQPDYDEDNDGDHDNSYAGTDVLRGCHDSSSNTSLTEPWRIDSHLSADESRATAGSDVHGESSYPDSHRPSSEFSSPATDIIMSPPSGRNSHPLAKRMKRN